MTDIQRNALARDLAMRQHRATLDELRVIDRLMIRVEQLRDLSLERRVSTGPGDVDHGWHWVVRPGGDSAITGCNGRWPITDPVERMAGVPLLEVCPACADRWFDIASTSSSVAGVMLELREETERRAALHEAARIEMTGGG